MSGGLRGKAVFLEIFNEMENISYAFQPLVTSLGGVVAPKFTKDVKYLVWKGGREWVWRKAHKHKITIVTPLWLDASDGEPKLADPQRYQPPDPCFDLLTKRTRKAFTSPAKKPPDHKRSRPLNTASKRKSPSPPMSSVKAKIDFDETSASDSEPVQKIFICGDSDSEVDACLRVIHAKATKKPATAEIAVVVNEDSVEEIAAALLYRLPIVSVAWLKEASEQLSWIDISPYIESKYQLQPALFAAYRFGVADSLQQGLAARLLTASGGTVATHPRLGDYFICDEEPPKLPSHIKIVNTEWIARCVTDGRILKNNKAANS